MYRWAGVTGYVAIAKHCFGLKRELSMGVLDLQNTIAVVWVVGSVYVANLNTRLI